MKKNFWHDKTCLVIQVEFRILGTWNIYFFPYSTVLKCKIFTTVYLYSIIFIPFQVAQSKTIWFHFWTENAALLPWIIMKLPKIKTLMMSMMMLVTILLLYWTIQLLPNPNTCWTRIRTNLQNQIFHKLFDLWTHLHLHNRFTACAENT